jgi:hypothetical protein
VRVERADTRFTNACSDGQPRTARETITPTRRP